MLTKAAQKAEPKTLAPQPQQQQKEGNTDHLADPLGVQMMKDPLQKAGAGDDTKSKLKVSSASGKQVGDPTKGYSVAVSGNGVLVDFFIDDAFRRLKNVTVYDRTAATNKARKKEADLGKSGLVNEEGAAAAEKTEQNLKSPPKVDISVNISRNEAKNTETVTISGPSGTQTFTYNVDIKTGTIAQVHGYAAAITSMVMGELAKVGEAG